WDKVDHLDWVPGIADSYHAENMMNLARSGWDNMVDLFGKFIPQEIRGYRDTFLEAIPKLQATRYGEPRTLCHGDFRMENLLYAARQDHHPVVVLDWQGPLLSRGMFDVALFLGQSTKKEVRQVHERQLLERYLSGLEQGGVTGLDADQTWEDYRSTNLYDWVYTAVVAGNLDASDEVAFAWMSQMVDRQSVVSLDLNVFDLLPD
ncbi:MAG: phosphotransferase, partial [Gammaproteobacteria bacterium]|nr:phosphotransferase [Gammaproteobacteria bacterium]